MSAKTYTTGEAAAVIGVSRQTLQTWIAAGKLKAPRPTVVGHVTVRLWTKTDINNASKVVPAAKRGPKLGRKRKLKA
jgi:excisionase family DNA binding protein